MSRRAKPNNTIYQLKLYIQEMDETSLDAKRLIFAGKQLEDERTLSYYIKNGSTMHLIPRLRVGCFVEGTTVLMGDENKCIDIENIKKNDIVMTYNMTTKQSEPHPVENEIL